MSWTWFVKNSAWQFICTLWNRWCLLANVTIYFLSSIIMPRPILCRFSSTSVKMITYCCKPLLTLVYYLVILFVLHSSRKLENYNSELILSWKFTFRLNAVTCMGQGIYCLRRLLIRMLLLLLLMCFLYWVQWHIYGGCWAWTYLEIACITYKILKWCVELTVELLLVQHVPSVS